MRPIASYTGDELREMPRSDFSATMRVLLSSWGGMAPPVETIRAVLAIRQMIRDEIKAAGTIRQEATGEAWPVSENGNMPSAHPQEDAFQYELEQAAGGSGMGRCQPYKTFEDAVQAEAEARQRSRPPKTTGLTFAEAVEALKAGCRITRAGRINVSWMPGHTDYAFKLADLTATDWQILDAVPGQPA